MVAFALADWRACSCVRMARSKVRARAAHLLASPPAQKAWPRRGLTLSSRSLAASTGAPPRGQPGARAPPRGLARARSAGRRRGERGAGSPRRGAAAPSPALSCSLAWLESRNKSQRQAAQETCLLLPLR